MLENLLPVDCELCFNYRSRLRQFLLSSRELLRPMMLKSLLLADFMLSGLPTTVAVAAVAAFAYLVGLMSRLDEAPAEPFREPDEAWYEGQEFAQMTDDVLAVTRKAFCDSQRLSRAAQPE